MVSNRLYGYSTGVWSSALTLQRAVARRYTTLALTCLQHVHACLCKRETLRQGQRHDELGARAAICVDGCDGSCWIAGQDQSPNRLD